MQFTVKPDENDLRLMDFLKMRLPGEWSTRKVKKLIDIQGCFLNGNSADVSTKRLRKGDQVEVLKAKMDRALAQRKKCKVIFEDEYFFAIEKPVGQISDAEDLKKKLSQYGDIRLVHRLDRETSGILLLAKNEKAQEMGEELFRSRAVKKVYYAIVSGKPVKNSGAIESTHYGKLGKLNGRDLWSSASSREKHALTRWFLEESKGKQSFLKIIPETGRTHQIRVHLSESGYPIIGDPLYGDFSIKAPRMLLHAHKLSFKHPVSAKEIELISDLPKEFRQF